MNQPEEQWIPWLERMRRLNVDRSRGVAPHKALLLFAVLDLIEEGRLCDGALPRNGNLAFRFASYWTIVAQRRRGRPQLKLPFYHMKTDGFWMPQDAEGRPAPARETAVTASVAPSFLTCAEDPGFRALARRILMAAYFAPHEQEVLQSLLCLERTPLEDGAAVDPLPGGGERNAGKREAIFQFRVLPAYDYTCALTGYRMVSVDGVTAVDAAHIHQLKRGGPNDPRNGIALSKTAHWLFDRGFWSIGDDYRVRVRSKQFDEAGAEALQLKRRQDQLILLPRMSQFQPGHEFLAWHRRRHGF